MSTTSHHREEWQLEISPQKMLEFLHCKFPRKDSQGALSRWFFMIDCDDKMVLQYELTFDGTNWWMPFDNKLIVPRLASQFIAISVVSLNEGYDVFHMLITRWKPVVLPESMMKKVLKRFMEKWVDGLCRWLFNAQPTKEEAVAWCQELMRLLMLDLLGIDSGMHNGLQLIHKTYEIPQVTQ